MNFRILLVLAFFASLVSAESKPFDFYSDGIYDTYIQLNKDIQAGLDDRYMQEYDNKYLVAISVDEVSMVKIIFYKTIGAKNSLVPVVVEHIPSGQNFLVFDAFDRKADARMLKEKLIGYNLKGVAIYDKSSGNNYRKNPIVIKKLIDDLKVIMRNTPVKVLTIEKDDGNFNTLPPLNTHLDSMRSGKSGTGAQGGCDVRRKVVDDFIKLRAEYCKHGFIKNNMLYMCKDIYKIGDDIKGFTLESIKIIDGKKVAMLLGTDGLYYKLKDSWCKDPKSPCGNVPEYMYDKSKVTAPQYKEEKPQAAKDVKTYYCNFTKIFTAREKDGKTVRITDTGYDSKEKVKVNIYDSNDKEYTVRGEGEDYLILSRSSFEKGCFSE